MLAHNADYARFIALRAASSGAAQISLFWRSLPVLWWLAWPMGIFRAGEPHLVWQRDPVLTCGGPGVGALRGKVTRPGGWCWLLPGRRGGMRVPGRVAWLGSRGRALGCQRH
jgi:hypothetical protein